MNKLLEFLVGLGIFIFIVVFTVQTVLPLDRSAANITEHQAIQVCGTDNYGLGSADGDLYFQCTGNSTIWWSYQDGPSIYYKLQDRFYPIIPFIICFAFIVLLIGIFIPSKKRKSK